MIVVSELHCTCKDRGIHHEPYMFTLGQPCSRPRHHQQQDDVMPPHLLKSHDQVHKKVYLNMLETVVVPRKNVHLPTSFCDSTSGIKCPELPQVKHPAFLGPTDLALQLHQNRKRQKTHYHCHGIFIPGQQGHNYTIHTCVISLFSCKTYPNNASTMDQQKAILGWELWVE